MRHVLALGFSVSMLVALLWTADTAQAQVLTIEVDTTDPQQIGAPSSPEPYVLRRRPPNRPVVEMPRPSPVAPQILTVRRPTQPVVVQTFTEYDRPPVRESDEDFDIEGSVWFGAFGETIDLSQLELSLDSPEIAALDGITLQPGWAGGTPLSSLGVGGAAIGFGIRGGGILRGPELRFLFSGSDAEGPFAAVPNADADLEMAVRSAFIFRAELAVGLQVELGPFTPYAVATASVGAASLDFTVRDARLGDIGNETATAFLAGLGVEAGVDIDVGDGMEIGAAFRGNFVNSPSYGAMVTIGYAGE